MEGRIGVNGAQVKRHGTGLWNNVRPVKIVLLVEDDAALRKSLAELVEAEGLRALAAGNGFEAVELLRHEPRPDLILLDLMMPVMNGWAFLKYRNEHAVLSSVPVVVTTGWNEVPGEADVIGVQGYLRKPLVPQSVLEVVRKYCR
jgi:CheY-like chemotaxis protein